jgi:hypothetical protein
VARARRAKPRPSRIVVPILIVAVVAATVVAWQSLPRTTDAQAGGPASVASSPATTSASPTPTPSSSAGRDDPAAARLMSCRQRVRQADEVLAAAKTGVGHWAEHVRAQTDANEGRITVDKMDGIFARTRLAGPSDQDRYRKAVADYEKADGVCKAVPGATRKESAALNGCQDRLDAQQPVLKAAAPAMADWKSHLAAMRRSRMRHMDDAEQIWVDAWRAAPPHIRAYDMAAAAFRDAAHC